MHLQLISPFKHVRTLQSRFKVKAKARPGLCKFQPSHPTMTYPDKRCSYYFALCQHLILLWSISLTPARACAEALAAATPQDALGRRAHVSGTLRPCRRPSYFKS